MIHSRKRESQIRGYVWVVSRRGLISTMRYESWMWFEFGGEIWRNMGWWMVVVAWCGDQAKKIGPMRTPRYHDENRPIGIPNFKTCSRRAHKDTIYQTPSHKKHPLSSLITWYSDYQCNHGKQSYPVSISPMIQHIETETKWPPFCRRSFETHFL